MLRIKGMTRDEAPEEVFKVFEEQEKQHGSILNTARVYGAPPDDPASRWHSKPQAGFTSSRPRLAMIPSDWTRLLESEDVCGSRSGR
jgi:hypothetical protein